MKIKVGQTFADKSGEKDYKITRISKKRNTVYIYSKKYKIFFRLPIDILESYLGEKDGT